LGYEGSRIGPEGTITRADFIRPIGLAITLTLFGELVIFLTYGVALFPEGNLLQKFGWILTCGIAMGATIGALVNLFVTGRMTWQRAKIWAGLIWVAVLSYCNILCYLIDLNIGFFGAQSAPVLFLAPGFVAIFLSAFLYSWLLYSWSGKIWVSERVKS
jgi:hypothetical protein